MHLRFVWAFCLCSFSGMLQAQDKPPVAVFLLFPDQKETSTVLERAIHSQLSDLDVVLVKKELPVASGRLNEDVELAVKSVQEHRGVAGFWFQMVSENQLYLYVIKDGGDRILIRTVEEVEEGGRTEAAAVIIRMSIAEILRGGTIAIEVPNEDPQKPRVAGASDLKEEPSKEEAARVPLRAKRQISNTHQRLEHTLSYAYYAHSTQKPANHGLDIVFGYRPFPEIAFFLEYTFLNPLKVEDETLVLVYERHPVRLGMKYAALVLPWLELAVSGAVLFDYVTYDVVSVHVVSPDKKHLLMGAFPRMELGFRWTSHFALVLSFGAEILINPEYYGHRQTGSRQVLLDGFRVQPWGLVGIRFSHLGRE